MSPENTHKLMGFYVEVLILGVVLQCMVSASLSWWVYRVKQKTITKTKHSTTNKPTADIAMTKERQYN